MSEKEKKTIIFKIEFYFVELAQLKNSIFSQKRLYLWDYLDPKKTQNADYFAEKAQNSPV